MRKTRWNLDLLAEKFYHTKFYKSHENLKVDFHGVLCDLIKKKQTPEIVLEQVKLLPGLYNHTNWPYRWGLYIDEQEYESAKEKAAPEITKLFFGEPADINIILGQLWKAAPYEELNTQVWNALYNRLAEIKEGKSPPCSLSCFYGHMDRSAFEATIGRFFVSLYKVLTAYPETKEEGDSNVVRYTSNREHRKEPLEYCLHYFVGHNRIVESAIDHYRDKPEIVLDLHRTTCDMILPNTTETLIEFLLICYSLLENIYGVEIE